MPFDMNKFLKKLLIFLLIPVISAIVLFYGMTLLVNSMTNEYKLNPAITEIYIGDSHIQSSVNDNLLENAKNLGQSSESFYFTYFKLKRILQGNPGIRKVYLGFSYHSLSIYYDKFISGEYSVSVSPHYFYILPVREQIRLLNWNHNNISSYLKSIFKAGRNQIDNLKDPDFFSGYANDFKKSAVVDSSMDKRLKFQYYPGNSISSFSEINLIYLNKIVELCRSRKIELAVLNTPLHSYYRNRIPKTFVDKYNEVIKQNGLKCFDYSTIAMDDSCYTPDGDHVSVKGSLIFTKNLSGVH